MPPPICYHQANPATNPITTAPKTHPTLPPRLVEPPPGNAFATLAVAAAPPSPNVAKQLAVPHAYPVGQHPSSSLPSSPPHINHPPAHPPLVAASGIPSPGTGTTTVTPFPLTTVVISPCGGHDAVAQSRPVWQQPPPARARQG
jgi:hypothetical protein